MNSVLIFHSAGAQFSGGAFVNLEEAKAWIATNKLTGLLTEYPLNQGLYDWAVSKEYFTPKRDEHRTPEFIGGFQTASLEHWHFEDGNLL